MLDFESEENLQIETLLEDIEVLEDDNSQPKGSLITNLPSHHVIRPRLKEMAYENYEVCDNTIEEYRLQLHQLMNIQSPTPEEHASSENLSSNNMFRDLIFGKSQGSQESIDDLDYYLDIRCTPLASPDSDPLL
ncbi:6008_t:CDS:2 [Racocetra persica]|uniref:6008_t:CDS:1 n=1 Tax=Racocetra persica TaxID=160502 RepID=A0ACA9LSV9_9GLOM|nr:6008_t:CDS:2 [Racocetra persica]